MMRASPIVILMPLMILIALNVQAQHPDASVAVLPFFDKNGIAIEKLNRSLLERLSTIYEPVDQIQFTHNITNHEEFNDRLSKFLSDVDVKRKKKVVNVYTGLNASEMERFRKNCLDADYLIFTSSIHSKRIKKIRGSGSITLYAKIYLVDLKSGKLLHEIFGKERFKYNQLTDETEAPMRDFLALLVSKLKAKTEL